MSQNMTEDLPALLSLTIRYFFVAIDRDMRSYRLLQYPISPNFRTFDEAKAFQNEAAISESYVIEAGLFLQDESERAVQEEALFSVDHHLSCA